MTAKEYLQKVKTMDMMIDLQKREVDHWRDLSTRISGSNFEPNYNSSRKTEPAFVKCIEKAMMIDEELNQSVDAFVAYKAGVFEQIHKLNNIEYQNLLIMRYLDYRSWGEIAAELKCSKRNVYRTHIQALEELEKNF